MGRVSFRCPLVSFLASGFSARRFGLLGLVVGLQFAAVSPLFVSALVSLRFRGSQSGQVFEGAGPASKRKRRSMASGDASVVSNFAADWPKVEISSPSCVLCESMVRRSVEFIVPRLIKPFTRLLNPFTLRLSTYPIQTERYFQLHFTTMARWKSLTISTT